jgi:hypothetical protein
MENIRKHIRKLLKETLLKENKVCKNCFHSWEIESSDKNPYLCHVCGFDNKELVFKIKELKDWQKNHYSKLNQLK